MVRRQIVAREITRTPTRKAAEDIFTQSSIDSSAITQPILGREAISEVSLHLARSAGVLVKIGRKSASEVSGGEAQKIKSQIAAAKAYSIASDLKELEAVFLAVHMHNSEAARAFSEFKKLNGRAIENFYAVAMQEAVRRLSTRKRRLTDLMLDYGIDSSRTPKESNRSSYDEYPLVKTLDDIESSASRIYNLGEELFSKEHSIPAERTYLLSYELRRIQGELLAFLNKDIESAKAYGKGIEISKNEDNIFRDVGSKFKAERYVQNGYIRYCVNAAAANTGIRDEQACYHIEAGNGILDCFNSSNSYNEKRDGSALIASDSRLKEMGIEEYRDAMGKLKDNSDRLVKEIQLKIEKLTKISENSK